MDQTPNQSAKQKLFVITPDQIAKLGLTAKLQNAISSQLKDKNKTTPAPTQGNLNSGNKIQIKNLQGILNQKLAIGETCSKQTNIKQKIEVKKSTLTKKIFAPLSTPSIILDNAPISDSSKVLTMSMQPRKLISNTIFNEIRGKRLLLKSNPMNSSIIKNKESTKSAIINKIDPDNLKADSINNVVQIKKVSAKKDTVNEFAISQTKNSSDSEIRKISVLNLDVKSLIIKKLNNESKATIPSSIQTDTDTTKVKQLKDVTQYEKSCNAASRTPLDTSVNKVAIPSKNCQVLKEHPSVCEAVASTSIEPSQQLEKVRIESEQNNENLIKKIEQCENTDAIENCNLKVKDKKTIVTCIVNKNPVFMKRIRIHLDNTNETLNINMSNEASKKIMNLHLDTVQIEDEMPTDKMITEKDVMTQSDQADKSSNRINIISSTFLGLNETIVAKNKNQSQIKRANVPPLKNTNNSQLITSTPSLKGIGSAPVSQDSSTEIITPIPKYKSYLKYKLKNNSFTKLNFTDQKRSISGSLHSANISNEKAELSDTMNNSTTNKSNERAELSDTINNLKFNSMDKMRYKQVESVPKKRGRCKKAPEIQLDLASISGSLHSANNSNEKAELSDTMNNSTTNKSCEKAELSDTINNSTLNSIDKMKYKQVESVPKKRGRRKKSPEMQVDLGKRKRSSVNYTYLNEGKDEDFILPEPVVKKIKCENTTDGVLHKKPGRPRKIIINLDETASQIDTNESLNSENNLNEEIEHMTKNETEIITNTLNHEMITPKKRGRPRKVIAEKSDDEHSLEASTSEIRAETENLAADSKTDATIEENHAINSKAETVVAIKKKHALAEVASDQTDQELTVKAFTQKKRGRPSKIKSDPDMSIKDICAIDSKTNPDLLVDEHLTDDFKSKSGVTIEENHNCKAETVVVQEKHAIAEPISDQIDKEIVIEAITKRKRGRPRKKPEMDVSIKDNCDVDVVEGNLKCGADAIIEDKHATNCKTETVVVQEKHTGAELRSDQIDSNIQIEAAHRKKRGGRPRKNITDIGNKQCDDNVNTILGESVGNDKETKQNLEHNPSKKRGRPFKERHVENDDSKELTVKEENESQDTLIEETEPTVTTSSKRKRKNDRATSTKVNAKKRKCYYIYDEDCEEETLCEKQNRLLVKNLVHEIWQEKADAEEKDVSLGKPLDKKMLKCAICRLVMKKTEWSNHKWRRHNNLTWACGATEMDLTDVVDVLYILTVQYQKKKPFYCNKCGVSKKSVVGYLGHRLQCCKTPEEQEVYKIECEECNSKVMPYSIMEHVKWHKKAQEKMEKTELMAENSVDTIDCPISKKREAAKKATEMIHKVSIECVEPQRRKTLKWYYNMSPIIQESDYEKYTTQQGDVITCVIEGCENTSQNSEEARNHFELCRSKQDKSYSCKFCDYISITKHDVYNHVGIAHSEHMDKDSDFEDEVSVDSDTDVDVDDNTPRKCRALPSNNTWRTYGLKFLNEAVYFKGISLYLNHWCYSKTLKFCEQNYIKDFNLFSDIQIKWTLLDPSVVHNYLPKLKQSMPISNEFVPQGVFSSKYTTELPFKKFKLFESTLDKNGYDTIFCGGPISTMAWTPTPFNAADVEQILAVAIIPDPDKSYSIAKLYNEKNILQFWNLGILNNTNGIKTAPKLEFCMAHELGIIWAMEWCPSGCYRNDQVGLLALSGTDTFVHGYSIPNPKMFNGKIYKTEPVFKLVLSKWTDFNVGGHQSYATRISWSKTLNHQHISVGYSNGMVAVYDLETQSSLLKMTKNGHVEYYPYVTFQAHNATVTGLSLYHLNGGNKWLATASSDRMVKFWNLEDVGEPIMSKKKSQIKEIVWMNNWIATVDAHDDCSNPLFQTTGLSQLRDFASQHSCTLMYSNSTINSVSASDWTNIIVQGTLMGEIIGCYVKHMLPFNIELQLKRFFMSYTKLKTDEGVDIKNDEHRNEFYDYKNTTQKSSLVFTDFEMNDHRKSTKTTEQHTNHRGSYQVSLLDMYPIQSINCIRINPNRYSFLFTATGYQSGFVRIMHTKFLSTKY